MGTGEDTLPKVRVLRVAGAVVVLFLGLFAWQFVAAWQANQERDQARLELAFQRMATDLAMASIEADYESFEGARELASAFFTRLQQNVDALPPEGRETANSILAQRDPVITALSRRDPESPEILVRMFYRYRMAIGEPERAGFMPAPPRGQPEGEAPGEAVPQGEEPGAGPFR